MEYGYKKELDVSHEDALEKVKESLQKEGFGILTEIDVKKTMKKKLDKDIDNYVILGACNPPNAFKSLQTEQDIGLLLPCNVIVYTKGSRTFVSSIKPTIAMSMVENEELKNIAKDIEEKLKTAIDAL